MSSDKISFNGDLAKKAAELQVRVNDKITERFYSPAEHLREMNSLEQSWTKWKDKKWQ